MVTKSKNPMVATTAGAIAGGIETLTIWPMEMIKTNLQLGTMRAQYTGMIGGFRYHVQTDGFGSLYRGLAPVLVGSIPKAGIRFGAFDFIKRRLADENGNASAMRNLAAGMMAGAIEATLTTTPIETLKTKLIGANASMWEGTKMILAKEGIRGIYQGLWATILKQSTNQGLRFMWFSEFQKRVSPEFLERHGIITDAQNMTGSQRASLSLIGGMTAGIFSVFGNNPFDVVKTRMQGLQAQKYKSTFDCFRQMLLHEGAGSFYAGVVPRLGRVIPGQGIIFMSSTTKCRYNRQTLGLRCHLDQNRKVDPYHQVKGGPMPATPAASDTAQMLSSLVSMFSLQQQAIANSQQQIHAFMAQQTRFQQEMYEMQARANRQKQKANPPKFHGRADDDLELWLFHIEEHFAAYTVEQSSNDSRFVDMVVPFLGVDVMAWYHEFKHAMGSNPRTWPLFKQQIRARYRDSDYEFKLLTKIHDLQVSGTQQEYSTKVMQLLSMSSIDMPEVVKRWFYQQNLRAETNSVLRHSYVTTLRTAINLKWALLD
ncbi:hypothetical protein PC122_g21208 [Phytophthora cactorum]|nr:hypothetical protein PC122_g21208 [Phytophthora cactorum]